MNSGDLLGTVESRSVTIGIPTIGDNPYLETALDSAVRALPADGEIVVSDNASESADRVEALARRDPLGRVRILRQAARLSMAENWNQCLRAARGAQFLLLSDDDVLDESFLVHAREYMNDPRTGFVYGRVTFIDEDDHQFWQAPRAPKFQHCADALTSVFRRKTVIVPSATLFRTYDLRASGGYVERYGNWTDMQAWIRVGAQHARVAFACDAIAYYRERSSSMTRAIIEDAWRDCITATSLFAQTAMPSHTRTLAKYGELYLEYMIADIRLKRLLARQTRWADYLKFAAQLSGALPLRERAWLWMKSIYLRLAIRQASKLN